MKANPNLDELLCSFMDGELSPRQRTEVQRMAARDPQVGRRLRQLQSCRTLFSALPQVEAPGDMMEQIKLSLERRTLLQEQPAAPRRSAGALHLVFRKFVAAAAMFALLGVLGVVVYQIVAPVGGPESPPFATDIPRVRPGEPGASAVPPTVVADAGFSGRLELRTASFASMDAFIRRAVENNALLDSAESGLAGDRRRYHIVGTRDNINHVVASLSSAWQSAGGATLYVDRPGDSATPVAVEAVTADQTVSIIARSSTEASVEAAQAFAVMNDLARQTPGGELLAMIGEDTGSMLAFAGIPKPRMTKPDDPTKTTLAPSQGQPNASLTIVLLDVE